MCGDGLLPFVLAERSGDPTVVVHHGVPDASPPTFEFVYVGIGDACLQPTPWSCPFVGPSAITSNYTNYLTNRADRHYWLALLHGKCLYCTCHRANNDCYGALLAEAANSLLVEMGYGARPGDPTPGCASPTGTVEDSDLLSAQAYAECKDDVDYLPPENTPGSEELLTSRAPDDLVPRPMPWPQRWIDLVDDFRRESGTRRSKIWVIFSGTAGLTKEFAAEGWPTGPPIDVVIDPNYNLLNPLFMAIAVGIISEGRVFLLHLAPPCSSFSVALNSAQASAVRSSDAPTGLPELPKYKEDKVKLGNALAEAMVVLASAQARLGRFVQFEQPARSLMLTYPSVISMTKEFKFVAYQRDACVDGAP